MIRCYTTCTYLCTHKSLCMYFMYFISVTRARTYPCMYVHSSSHKNRDKTNKRHGIKYFLYTVLISTSAYQELVHLSLGIKHDKPQACCFSCRNTLTWKYSIPRQNRSLHKKIHFEEITKLCSKFLIGCLKIPSTSTCIVSPDLITLK